MAATPQERKKFINKGMSLVEEGLPGWFGTFADMMTLLFAFLCCWLQYQQLTRLNYRTWLMEWVNL